MRMHEIMTDIEAGRRATRQAWDSEDPTLVPWVKYEAGGQEFFAKRAVGDVKVGDKVTTKPTLKITREKHGTEGYVPSVADLLADDWMLEDQ